MNDLQRISINSITANPYQTRFEENTERIASIALSIALDGLLQPPNTRQVEKSYQLAFGHTRTAGWKLCNDIQLGIVTAASPELAEAVRNSAEDYSTIPVYVSEITDEKMFRHAVTENAQRSDLSPVEEATAMKRAMDEFKYTSEQAGELFGKNGSTVRGKVRLLDLPDEARALLHEGALSEGAARLLITLDRMVPDAVSAAIKKIVEEGSDPEDVVDYALRDAPTVKMIYSSHFDIKAKTFKYLPTLTGDFIANALEIEKDKRLMNCINAAKDPVDLVQTWKTSDFENDPALAGKVERLLKPPACTACELYAKVDGSDYCGWLACFARKQASNDVSKVEAASKKLGIAIYQESDGPTYQLISWNDAHEKYVEKRNPDLRLIKSRGTSGNWGYKLDIASDIAVVAVGGLLEKIKKANAQSAANQGKVTKDASPEDRIKALKVEISEKIVQDQFDTLVFDTFVPFLDVLSGVKSAGALKLIADMFDIENERAQDLRLEKRAAAAELKYWRSCLTAEMIERSLNWEAHTKTREAKLPASELAKYIRKIAETFDVKLGTDFDQAVAKADLQLNELRRVAIKEAIQPVSAETGKKAKKK